MSKTRGGALRRDGYKFEDVDMDSEFLLGEVRPERNSEVAGIVTPSCFRHNKLPKAKTEIKEIVYLDDSREAAIEWLKKEPSGARRWEKDVRSR